MRGDSRGQARDARLHRDDREAALERALEVMATRYGMEHFPPTDYLAAFKREDALDLYPPARPPPAVPRYPRRDSLSTAASTPNLTGGIFRTQPSSVILGSMSVGNLTLDTSGPSQHAWTMTTLVQEPAEDGDGEEASSLDDAKQGRMDLQSARHSTKAKAPKPSRPAITAARSSTKATVNRPKEALQNSPVHDPSAPRTKRRGGRPGLEAQIGGQSGEVPHSDGDGMDGGQPGLVHRHSSQSVAPAFSGRHPVTTSALARSDEIRAMRCKLVGGSSDRLPPLLQAQHRSELMTESGAFSQRSQKCSRRAHSIHSRRPSSQRYQAAFPRALFDVSTNRSVSR